jgi:hypothetical protein
VRQMRSSGIARVADWESRARASGLTPETYPISWSWLLGSTRASKDAEQLLARTQPANEWDAAVRQVALWGTRDKQRFRATPQETDQELGEMLGVLSGLPEESPPLWLREFLVMTTWPLENRGWGQRLPRHEELRAVRRRLLAMPTKAAEAALEDFDMTERARIRASKTTWDHMLGDFGPY